MIVMISFICGSLDCNTELAWGLINISNIIKHPQVDHKCSGTSLPISIFPFFSFFSFFNNVCLLVCVHDFCGVIWNLDCIKLMGLMGNLHKSNLTCTPEIFYYEFT
jgi:hypothetical protein